MLLGTNGLRLSDSVSTDPGRVSRTPPPDSAIVSCWTRLDQTGQHSPGLATWLYLCPARPSIKFRTVVNSANFVSAFFFSTFTRPTRRIPVSIRGGKLTIFPWSASFSSLNHLSSLCCPSRAQTTTQRNLDKLVFCACHISNLAQSTQSFEIKHCPRFYFCFKCLKTSQDRIISSQDPCTPPLPAFTGSPASSSAVSSRR